MTEREMRKLSRRELLEMLLEQTKEVERLQKQVQKLTQKLESRALALSEAGSIAEASLRLSGVFEAAQAAADQYLDNIRRQKEETDEQCRQLVAQAKEKCQEVLRCAGGQEPRSELAP